MKMGKKRANREHAEEVLSYSSGGSGKKREGGKRDIDSEGNKGERKSADKRQKTMTSFFPQK